MDSLDAYIEYIAKENKLLLDIHDPICALHTFLKKFETDLLLSEKKLLDEFSERIENICSKVEYQEKIRVERSLSYITESAQRLMQNVPQTVNTTLQRDDVKKLLLQCALQTMQERITISVPYTVWLFGGCLAALNILVLIIAVLRF